MLWWSCFVSRCFSLQFRFTSCIANFVGISLSCALLHLFIGTSGPRIWSFSEVPLLMQKEFPTRRKVSNAPSSSSSVHKLCYTKFVAFFVGHNFATWSCVLQLLDGLPNNGNDIYYCFLPLFCGTFEEKWVFLSFQSSESPGKKPCRLASSGSFFIPFRHGELDVNEEAW